MRQLRELDLKKVAVDMLQFPNAKTRLHVPQARPYEVRTWLLSCEENNHLVRG